MSFSILRSIQKTSKTNRNPFKKHFVLKDPLFFEEIVNNEKPLLLFTEDQCRIIERERQVPLDKEFLLKKEAEAERKPVVSASTSHSAAVKYFSKLASDEREKGSESKRTNHSNQSTQSSQSASDQTPEANEIILFLLALGKRCFCGVARLKNQKIERKLIPFFFEINLDLRDKESVHCAFPVQWIKKNYLAFDEVIASSESLGPFIQRLWFPGEGIFGESNMLEIKEEKETKELLDLYEELGTGLPPVERFAFSVNEKKTRRVLAYGVTPMEPKRRKGKKGSKRNSESSSSVEDSEEPAKTMKNQPKSKEELARKSKESKRDVVFSMEEAETAKVPPSKGFVDLEEVGSEILIQKNLECFLRSQDCEEIKEIISEKEKKKQTKLEFERRRAILEFNAKVHEEKMKRKAQEEQRQKEEMEDFKRNQEAFRALREKAERDLMSFGDANQEEESNDSESIMERNPLERRRETSCSISVERDSVKTKAEGRKIESESPGSSEEYEKEKRLKEETEYEKDGRRNGERGSEDSSRKHPKKRDSSSRPHKSNRHSHSKSRRSYDRKKHRHHRRDSESSESDRHRKSKRDSSKESRSRSRNKDKKQRR